MTSRSINYYRYFCNTENKYVYDWSETIPVSCSNDITHHIDNTSFTIVDTVQSNNITIKQFSNDIHGSYRIESKTMFIPANQTFSTYVSWPFNVSILTVNYTTNNIHKGDIINGYIGENTIIGKITQPINIGDFKIHVSDSVLDYINKGYLVNITDGVHVVNMEQCISIDKANNILLCEYPVNMSLNAESFVRITVHNMKNIHISEPESVRIANKHLGSSSIIAGTKVKMEYQNNGNVAKSFTFSFEYLY